MRIVPENDHIHIEVIEQEESKGNFQWAKQSGDLTAVRVVTANNTGNSFFDEDDVLIVISTMIQEFEYKKNKFKVCPRSAVIASVFEE